MEPHILAFAAFDKYIEDLTHVDESKLYDLVYSFGVLHHTPETELAVDNIWKLLKYGGEFKLMMYAKNLWKFFEIKDGLDQYEAQSGVPIAKVYTHDEIRALLHKFKDIEITQTHISLTRSMNTNSTSM